MKTALWYRIGAAIGGFDLRVDEVAGGVRRYRLSSRLSRRSGMEADAYLVGTLLIDTGFAHAAKLLREALTGVRLTAICLTHHHEDHSGGAGWIAEDHRCSVFLRNAGRRREEGLSALAPYRLAWWGTPPDFDAAEPPASIEYGGGMLRSVPIPGHSATHTAYFDEVSGVVFTGDLYVSGGATAVMSHENPFESVVSLRSVADLDPSWMLSGHGLAMEKPAGALRAKADRIEAVAAETVRLSRAGVPESAILSHVFPDGHLLDLAFAALTRGEFSRRNFVRNCILYAPVKGPRWVRNARRDAAPRDGGPPL